MKKKWLILISILVLVFAGVIWFNTGSEPPIVVEGDHSAKDIAEIKRVVHSALRRQIFPNFSWKSVKELPKNFMSYSRFKITKVTFEKIGVGDRINVAIVLSSPSQPGAPVESFFQLIKGTNGWKIGHLIPD